MEIEVEIARHYLQCEDKSGNILAAIFLKDKDSGTAMPIYIGLEEAKAIFREMLGMVPPRPMTHDLIKNLITDKIGAVVTRVVVNALSGTTFYGLIYMDRGGEILTQDSRPSDAIAVALRFSAKIFVEYGVFLEAVEDERTKALFAQLEEKGIYIGDNASLDENAPPKA